MEKKEKKKIELIEEKSWGGDTWYCVYLNGVYVKGSSHKVLAEQIYEALIEDHRALEPKKTVLKSDEL